MYIRTSKPLLIQIFFDHIYSSHFLWSPSKLLLCHIIVASSTYTTQSYFSCLYCCHAKAIAPAYHSLWIKPFNLINYVTITTHCYNWYIWANTCVWPYNYLSTIVFWCYLIFLVLMLHKSVWSYTVDKYTFINILNTHNLWRWWA